MSSMPTSSPSTKRATALLTALRQSRSEVETLLAMLTPDDLARPTICTGWSVRDQIGHIIDATEMLINGLNQAASGQPEGTFRPHEMAKAMQTKAIQRAALLTIPQLRQDYSQAADRLITLLESRDPQSWDDGVPHPYLGTCPAVQFAGFALLDWFIHPWDIQIALDRQPVPRPEQAALLINGLVAMLPLRLDPSKAYGLKGRFRYQVEKEGDPSKIVNSLDVVVNNRAATVERDVADTVPAEVTFKGKAGDLVLVMLGRKGLSSVVQPSPANEKWLSRWSSLWISL